MGIQFQCDNRLFAAVFARAKMILGRQQKQFCGYEQNTGNSVYEQMEAIYQALSERNPVSRNDQNDWHDQNGCNCQSSKAVPVTISEREAIFSGKETIFLAASSEQNLPDQTGGMDLAIYFCSLLLEIKLHPVLIFSEERIAVGVWIYEDYNVGEARISTPDFAEEAYDAGGMILPVDCDCLMRAASFSQAVEAGCQIVEDFLFAEDIMLENKEWQDSTVILVDSKGNQETPLNLCEDETCPYFKELLSLYDQVSEQDLLAASILSDAVRYQQWAAAFFGDWEPKKDFPKTDGTLGIFHLPEMKPDEIRLTEMICQTSLLLVETEEKRQKLITADAILQELNQGNRVLLLAPKEQLEEVASLFTGKELSASILLVEHSSPSEEPSASLTNQPVIAEEKPVVWNESFSSAELYNFLMERCEKKEKPDDKRIRVKKRRYSEILEKIEAYNRILDTMTGCGKTLGELLEKWEMIKDYPVDIAIPHNKEWKIEILNLIKQYADALEKCRLRDQEGEIYLDFGNLTPTQEEELIGLLHDCEKPAGILYTAVEAFGRKIGRARGQNENARSYLQAITGCAELLEGCLSLLELQKAPEYIPEAQESDREEKEAYEAFLTKQQNRKVLDQFINSAGLSLLEGEELTELLEACNEVQNERSNHSLIKSRAYKVALKELQELLEPMVKPGVVLKHLNSESWNGICLGLMEYGEQFLDIQGQDELTFEEKESGEQTLKIRKSNEKIFQEMSELLGNNVLSDSYLFTYQKMLVQNLMELKKSGVVSDWLVLQLSECILSASQKNELEPGRKKLYEDARKIMSVFESYSEALKKVFRFLKIDYHTFLQSYKNESMMSFVVTWEQLLEEEKVFDEFHKIRMTLLRKQLGGVLEQFAEKNLTSEMVYRGFEKAWYDHNLNQYMEESGFNLQDYSMNLASICRIEEQIYRNEELQLENRLLRNVKLACQELREEMEIWKQESMGPEARLLEALQQFFPVMLMTPETALLLFTDSDIFFDRILICAAEEIPFYKILYSVTRGQTLSLITGQVQAMEEKVRCGSAKEINLTKKQPKMDSAAERARKMSFPVISGI